MQVSCTKCGVTVTASYLKQNTARLHGICVPKMRGVGKVGGGPTTYMIFLTRVMQSVILPVPGCPEVAHSAGWLR